MSIADELRDYTEEQIKWLDMTKVHYRKLLAIADRIDVEHERLMQEQPYTIDMVRMTDENMAEHGWVRGPLDADGKIWRSGDMSDSNWGVIEGIAYENGRWLVSGHDMSAPWIPADSIRHNHEPTVEDVLRELEGMRGNGADYETVVMRCAELAKTLRGLLAEDVEEQS